MTLGEEHRPYFEAAQQIMDGTAVEELDAIRELCNQQWMQNNGGSERQASIHYTMDVIVLSFAVDAENKILQGMDPHDAYKEFAGLTPEGMRETSRDVMRVCISEYFRQNPPPSV